MRRGPKGGVMFVGDLPSCCRRQAMRLPRPASVAHQVVGGSRSSEAWLLGLDDWSVDVFVSWDDDQDDLRTAIETHADQNDLSWDSMRESLSQHGVDLDEDGYAYIGSQQRVVANLASDWNASLGRDELVTSYQVWLAADHVSGDLDELVSPLVNPHSDDGGWSSGCGPPAGAFIIRAWTSSSPLRG